MVDGFLAVISPYPFVAVICIVQYIAYTNQYGQSNVYITSVLIPNELNTPLLFNHN